MKYRLNYAQTKMKKLTILVLLSLPFLAICQEEGLEDPDPSFYSDEYELIILDGDTILRSKVTKEIYTMDFRKRGATPSLSADWMNVNWDTKVFNPYKNVDPITWPITLSFQGEQFTMPIEGPITSRFGWRRGSPHRGIDIDLVTGDNVMAAMSGKVRFARYYSGFGNCVVIRHNNGLETIYAHLSKILVKPNDYIYSGQVLGKGGNTGKSRGSHLHFEARWFNKAINPEYLFDFETTKSFTALDLVVDELWADPRKHRSYRKSKIVIKRPTNQFYTPEPNQFTTVDQTNTQEGTFTKETVNSEGFKKDSESTFEKTVNDSDGLSKTGNEEKYHIISDGETVAKIASTYNTTIENILILNGLKRTSVIHVGQRLRVK